MLQSIGLTLLLVLPTVTASLGLLGKGINLGNVLEAPTEGAWAPPAQSSYFDQYKMKGFTTVRIPIRWDQHTQTEAPYQINATWLARVQEVVGWSLQRNFNTIINAHHDDWMDNSTTFTQMLPRYLAIWQQVTTVFSNAPSECGTSTGCLMFEALNEPVSLTIDQLNTLQQDWYTLIRGTTGHKNRWLLVGGLQWMNPAWLISNPTALIIPGLADGDTRIGVEVHSYDPFKFTSPPVSIHSWGSSADRATALDMFQNVAAWATKYAKGIPLVLGEFACSIEQSNTTARLAWWNAFAQDAEQVQLMGFCIWDDDGEYLTFDRKDLTWNEAVLQAIGLN
jgi:endoglucanase